MERRGHEGRLPRAQDGAPPPAPAGKTQRVAKPPTRLEVEKQGRAAVLLEDGRRKRGFQAVGYPVGDHPAQRPQLLSRYFSVVGVRAGKILDLPQRSGPPQTLAPDPLCCTEIMGSRRMREHTR